MVGGREDKTGDRMILSEVARRAHSSVLVIATLASEEPIRQWETYREAFGELGIREVEHLEIHSREDAAKPKNAEIVKNASAIFFTGGDQLKISSKLGGTSLLTHIRALYEERGGVIAGTSAGAAAMGASMLVSHGTEQSHKVEGAFYMARGLGLVRDLVIDQHFAQRARIERLVGAVAEDPGVLGIGIDEDTAVIFEDNLLRIIGSGAVYVVDGYGITYSNVSEGTSNRTLCLFDLKLHVLSHGSVYNLETRCPSVPENDGTGTDPNPSRTQQQSERTDHAR
jgi:cyanophycinase